MNAVNESLIRDVVSEVLGRLGGVGLSQVPRRRVPTQARFRTANGQGDEAIEFQGIDRRSANRADANCAHSVPAKVQAPRIAAWVEDSNVLACARVNRALSCCLAQRAANTRQRQVVQQRLTARVKWNHIVNVERGFLTLLNQAAILAPVASALDDLMPQVRRNGHGVTRCVPSRARLASAGGRGVPPDPPALLLRAAQPPSTVFSDPACRAKHEGAVRAHWGAEVWPGRSATPLRTVFACSYSLNQLRQKLPGPERDVQSVFVFPSS